MARAPHHGAALRLQAWVLGGGLLLLAIKFFAWWQTNSNAILADALESIVNVVAGAFALFSLYTAALPRDRNHPYGHGKVEFIAAGLEGSLIAVAGLGMIGKGLYNFFEPQPLAHLDLGLVLSAAAGLANFGMGKALERFGRRHHSLTLVADGKHLQSDAWSSAGLVLGLVLIRLSGAQWIDNLMAILFGLWILFTGYRLLRTSAAGIMDEADEILIADIIGTLEARRRPEWVDVHNFRIIKYGAALHVDCHLTLPWYFTLREAHARVKAFERAVADCCEQPVELFIHADPCEPPRACRICRKADCDKRQADFVAAPPWTLEVVLSRRPHWRDQGAD